MLRSNFDPTVKLNRSSTNEISSCTNMLNRLRGPLGLKVAEGELVEIQVLMHLSIIQPPNQLVPFSDGKTMLEFRVESVFVCRSAGLRYCCWSK